MSEDSKGCISFSRTLMSHLKILGASWGRDASSIVRNLVARPMLHLAFVHTWWQVLCVRRRWSLF